MATVAAPHDLKRELGINADNCPTFRDRFNFEQQKALIDEDLFAAKSVMAVLFTIVTGGLALGAGTVLILTMLR
ncbi:MAG: hypothetical protein MI757_12165 [Pirellulales bacterium]|nr:hypothetical protein [Pirellulales bacterium]